MYSDINFPSKKALKDAVAAGRQVRAYQPNDAYGKTDSIQVGEHTVYLEGPHYPQPHRWYAQATVRDGVIVKVK